MDYNYPMLLRTLGGLELEGVNFHRPKPLLLLAYLALEGPQERGHLAELFFRGSKKARANLSVVLSRLRHGAPGAIGADDSRIWTDVQTDAQHLLTALEGETEENLNLYGGPFLEGVSLNGSSSELEEWVYGTREFLASQVQTAFLKQAEGEAAKGNFDGAAERAESAYNLAQTTDPATLGRLHTLLLAGGKLIETRLREELAFFELPLCGSQEEAKEQLLELFRNSESAIPNNLQARETSFVGRDLELAEISQLLMEHRLVTLVGSGGIGKSRLVVQLAQQQLKADVFKDGIFFVALDVLTSPTAIPTSIASALSLNLQGNDEPLSQVSHYLADKRVLLVLDNFEHLIDSATLASELLAACPKLSLLITSRERLNLEEEWRYELAGLSYPEQTELRHEDAKHFDAVQLFAERAQQAKPEFIFGEHNVTAILKLCQLVEGMPLALELAATWTRIMTCGDIIEELAQGLDLFTTTTRNVPEKHKSIRASFEYSWSLLRPTEQAVMRKLSVFRDGFRREAAKKIADASIALLASLVDRSLLHLSSNHRYNSHPLLYQYSQEKLADHPLELSITQAKHGRYYFELLEKHGDNPWGIQGEALLAIVDEELENIRTVWTWAIREERGEDLIRIATYLDLYFRHRAVRPKEATQLLDEIIDGFCETNPNHQAVLGVTLIRKGGFLYDQDEFDDVIQISKRGLKLLETHDNYIDVRVMGLEVIGNVTLKVGDFTLARQYFKQALALALTSPDPTMPRTSLYHVALAEMALGNYTSAEHHLLQALTIARKHDSLYSLAHTLPLLGKLNLLMGRTQVARDLFEEGLQVANKQGFKQMIVESLIGLGEVDLQLGNCVEAREKFQQALSLARDMSSKSDKATITALLASVKFALGSKSEALTLFRQSFTLALSSHFNSVIPGISVLLGELLIKEKRLDEASLLLSWLTNCSTIKHEYKNKAQQLLQIEQVQPSLNSLDEAERRLETFNIETVIKEILSRTSVEV